MSALIHLMHVKVPTKGSLYRNFARNINSDSLTTFSPSNLIKDRLEG